MNLPLVEKGIDLNKAQIYFLSISDPLLGEEKVEEKKTVIFNELGTHMPLEIAKQQLRSMGINYDKLGKSRRSQRRNKR